MGKKNNQKRVVYIHIKHPKLFFVSTEKVQIVNGLFFVYILKYSNLFLPVCVCVYAFALVCVSVWHTDDERTHTKNTHEYRRTYRGTNTLFIQRNTRKNTQKHTQTHTNTHLFERQNSGLGFWTAGNWISGAVIHVKMCDVHFTILLATYKKVKYAFIKWK